ncbi:hypothetical protein LMH87_003232 [Akanthomyces muscarius]|uniref:Protamine P1 n=1 Tax=Akanthomyces muscarius TaxID=2231603 RepID=A0A9W8UGN9_AKAMU|nr:hypothetical protein LMH87_003232 [Akanthomyces muscarius]KAJ4144345.1 hypothetical protein LMH87_003232 [Akanthomyces muscarius]
MSLDRSECHLPSPQSLKTASLSADAHPFLEDEELQAVQAWRHNIHSTEPDVVQQATPTATDAISPLKRKASHNWLKTVPDKRTRAERAENDASDRSKRRFSAFPDLSLQGGEQPDLVTNARLGSSTRFSPRNSTSQLISPPKQSLGARNTAKSPVPVNSKPSEKPSQEQQAAATLSSPVSLRNVKQEKPDTQPSPLKFKVKVHVTSDASQWLDTLPPKTTAMHYTASNGVVQKPYRVPDDEDFVFDLAMAPPSDFSESEDDESSQEVEHATEAALEEPQPSVRNEKPGPETDGSSDSDLTELSGSPELSDINESAEESEAVSAEELDEMQDDSSEAPDFAEMKMVDDGTASESMRTTDEVQVERPTEAEESLDWEGFSTAEDASEMGKTADASEVDEIPGVAMSHSVLKETTCLLANESHDASGSETCQMPQQDAVEPAAELNAADHVSSPVAEEERVQSSPCVTEASTHSVAEPAVPPSPKVKQESSEFSLRAMFRNLVPTKSWAQLTHLTSSPPQATMQELIAPATTEEHVLPSVEDVDYENVSGDESDGTPMMVELGSETGEQSATLHTGAAPAKEGDEACQHSLPEPGSALASEKPATPQHQPVAEGSFSRTALEQNQSKLSDEPTAENETADPVAVAGVPQEPHTPSGRETTPAPCTATDEIPPAVETPVTPVTAKTPSPVSKATDSEPRFAFKSFAAFTTPSPERLRVRKRRTLTGSSLRHARLKSILSSGHADSTRRRSNRVSWLLPGEQDAEGSHSEGKAGASHGAPSSPPPRTPLAELPTAANEKFAKHFSSVVKRTDGLRHRFHVTANTDRGVGSLALNSSSQTSSIVARSKNTVGDAMEGTPSTAAAASHDVENQGSRPREATLSVEPMDMVEDMVREMGDFWQAWDVDAELSAAKKAQVEAGVSSSQSRNAWR